MSEAKEKEKEKDKKRSMRPSSSMAEAKAKEASAPTPAECPAGLYFGGKYFEYFKVLFEFEFWIVLLCFDALTSLYF